MATPDLLFALIDTALHSRKANFEEGIQLSARPSMTSLLQGLLHITDFGGPVTKTALPVVATCFAIQNAVGIPSVLAQTEHVYDLSGGWTFVAGSAVSLLARVLRKTTRDAEGGIVKELNWRQLAMTGGVMLYALRRGCISPRRHFS